MQLSIIIVNFNNYNLTQKCIDSVLNTVKNLTYEIIVIDNNSANNSYDVLNTNYGHYENIMIIKNEKNIGFGAANNMAVSKANSNYILFLNPDVIVIKDAIDKMYNRIINDEGIGLIGCKLLNEDLSLQYSCRRFLEFKEFVQCRTPMKKIIEQKKVDILNSKYLMLDYDHKDESYVDWVMGSCMLIKKDLLQNVGGFSKEYFMYFEDVDLCYKLNQVGKKILYFPEAEMIHLHNQESVKKINKMTIIHLNSMRKFYAKYRKN